MKCHWMRAALVIFEDPVCNGAFSKKIRSFWWILYPNEKLIAALQEDDWALKASKNCSADRMESQCYEEKPRPCPAKTSSSFP